MTISIVAVHGLAVDPKKTWKTQGVNWLKDAHMLPNIVPESRIMLFEYESEYQGESAIAQRLSLIAERLLLELDASRTQCGQRPLLFIGHCFGGVVIEKALVLAKLRAEQYGSILHSTRGILFLGTPHRGTTTQTIPYHISTISSYFIKNEPGLLELMRLNSEGLKDVLYDFCLLAYEARIPLFCFFEQYPTDIMRAIRYALFIPTFILLPKWRVSPCIPKLPCQKPYTY
jgi:hypothetical protein